jgi:glucose/arabinose dehydrogenase
LDNLPDLGNYHTNIAAIGPDEKIYFSQGALTNLGVIGMDPYQLGWLGQPPHNCDLPGYSVTLNGQTFETENPLPSEKRSKAFTGAFSDFGKAYNCNTRMEAALPYTVSIMGCNPDGTELELVAWGIRNAYGLGFFPMGV